MDGRVVVIDFGDLIPLADRAEVVNEPRPSCKQAGFGARRWLALLSLDGYRRTEGSQLW